MPSNAVCTLCLAMDVPIHNILASPLQTVYDKLTYNSSSTVYWPVLACYLCYSQLRKCHDLMVRSLKAKELLTQLLRRDVIVNLRSINIKIRELREQNELIITRSQLIVIPGSGNSLIDANIKEEPLPPPCKEHSNTNRRKLTDYLNCEEDLDSVVGQDLGSISILPSACQDSMDWEEIDKELEDAIYKMQENPDEMDTIVKECYLKGYLKFENSGGEHDYKKNEMTGEEGSKRVKPLSSQRKELTETDSGRYIYYLKFEDSEYEEDEFTDRQEVEDDNLREAVVAENIEAGATPAEKYKETHAENTQDESIPIPGGKNILEETKIHKAVLEQEANDCTSTNIDIRVTSNKQLRGTFVCYYCGNVFCYEYLLIEHIQHHITGRKTSCEESSQQRNMSREQKFISRTGVVNKVTEIHSGKKPFECEICKFRFTRKANLKRHLRIHTGEKPYEWEICHHRHSDKSSLKNHLRIHTGEKPYECEICKVSFNRKYHLQIHARIHTGEKPYECEICKVRFSDKRNLRQHTRIHIGEKPYECDICKDLDRCVI